MVPGYRPGFSFAGNVAFFHEPNARETSRACPSSALPHCGPGLRIQGGGDSIDGNSEVQAAALQSLR